MSPISLGTFWCEGRDLNSHDVTHTHLKRARLPFRHLREQIYYTSILFLCQLFIKIFITKHFVWSIGVYVI